MMPRPGQQRSPVHYSSVLVPAEYGYYGDINNVSANGMYKRYLSWFIGKYGDSKRPLTFKEWLLWAHKKGLVVSADGVKGAPGVDEVKAAATGTGKRIAVAILLAMAVVLVIKGMPVKNQTPAPAAV